MDISGYPRSLIDISGYLVLVEFGRIIRLMESSRFLRYRVDISRNLRLMDFSGFLKFRLRVGVVCYKIFLFIVKGNK